MKIIYFSLTGNVERFVNKTDYECIRGNENMVLDEEYVLITYTIKFGEIPSEVEKFLETNHKNLVGVIGSGNKNWGIKYCKAAYLIAEEYNVDVLQTFELAGNTHDVKRFNQIIKELL